MNLLQAWQSAKISEPLGFANEQMQTVGAIVIPANTYIILSLDPASDFELNSDIIHEWKAVFQASDGKVLGDANYQTLLHDIHPHILDQQDGSVLIKPLTDQELIDLYTTTIFD